jgi:hypothetical protein
MNDSKIEVRLFPFGCEVKTRFWVSDKATKGLTEFILDSKKKRPLAELTQSKKNKDGRAFVKKLKEICVKGFADFEGEHHTDVVRPEGQDVFRIGIHGSLFRVLGFYGEGNKTEFFAIYAEHYKSGTGRGSRGDELVDKVTEIRKSKLVRKVVDDVPRHS